MLVKCILLDPTLILIGMPSRTLFLNKLGSIVDLPMRPLFIGKTKNKVQKFGPKYKIAKSISKYLGSMYTKLASTFFAFNVQVLFRPDIEFFRSKAFLFYKIFV